MAKGSAWKSQFLLSAIVFVAGLAATLCFSYLSYAKAEKDWNIRVDQTAERLSNTLLSWMEESYAPVSGLVALVENSNTVEPGEFLNAFEGMQSRSTTVLLDEASLLRLNRDGRWQVAISSDTLGYPGRYITLPDVAADLVAGIRATKPIHSQSAVQIRERPDRFSDRAFRFRRHGGDHRCRNVELRYTARGHAVRTGTERYLSEVEWTLSW